MDSDCSSERSTSSTEWSIENSSIASSSVKNIASHSEVTLVRNDNGWDHNRDEYASEASFPHNVQKEALEIVKLQQKVATFLKNADSECDRLYAIAILLQQRLINFITLVLDEETNSDQGNVRQELTFLLQELRQIATKVAEKGNGQLSRVDQIHDAFANIIIPSQSSYVSLKQTYDDILSIGEHLSEFMRCECCQLAMRIAFAHRQDELADESNVIQNLMDKIHSLEEDALKQETERKRLRERLLGLEAERMLWEVGKENWTTIEMKEPQATANSTSICQTCQENSPDERLNSTLLDYLMKELDLLKSEYDTTSQDRMGAFSLRVLNRISATATQMMLSRYNSVDSVSSIMSDLSFQPKALAESKTKDQIIESLTRKIATLEASIEENVEVEKKRSVEQSQELVALQKKIQSLEEQLSEKNVIGDRLRKLEDEYRRREMDFMESMKKIRTSQEEEYEKHKREVEKLKHEISSKEGAWKSEQEKMKRNLEVEYQQRLKESVMIAQAQSQAQRPSSGLSEGNDSPVKPMVALGDGSDRRDRRLIELQNQLIQKDKQIDKLLTEKEFHMQSLHDKIATQESIIENLRRALQTQSLREVEGKDQMWGKDSKPILNSLEIEPSYLKEFVHRFEEVMRIYQAELQRTLTMEIQSHLYSATEALKAPSTPRTNALHTPRGGDSKDYAQASLPLTSPRYDPKMSYASSPFDMAQFVRKVNTTISQNLLYIYAKYEPRLKEIILAGRDNMCQAESKRMVAAIDKWKKDYEVKHDKIVEDLKKKLETAQKTIVPPQTPRAETPTLRGPEEDRSYNLSQRRWVVAKGSIKQLWATLEVTQKEQLTFLLKMYEQAPFSDTLLRLFERESSRLTDMVPIAQGLSLNLFTYFRRT
eukprot:TRINITY_DN5322_c0_g2_i2.p1 TRINITY_DN5322_c0_g2~~TRINITY_DN5322_c0_g2_i2.p1  ORF type:complete len:882 (+),score=155.61 TRINITY_DN5322_c0_g2_i2:51-2696(+)